MTGNSLLEWVIAFLTGYLFGSLPSAFLITKWRTGEDIRKLGLGNVGALNTFKSVGRLPSITVALLDVAKGAAACAISHYLLRLDQPLVLLTGLASIAGHNWMPWLKFSGGKGMGASVGVLVFVFLLYGYAVQLAIFLGIIAVMFALSRNLVLANAIAIVALPFIAWLGTGSGMLVVWSLGLMVLVGVKFLAPWTREVQGWLGRRGAKRA